MNDEITECTIISGICLDYFFCQLIIISIIYQIYTIDVLPEMYKREYATTENIFDTW